MANGQFFCKEGKNFTIEKRFNELPKRLETPRIIAVYNNKFNPKLIAHDLKDPGDRSKVKVGNWCGLSFVGYIPNAIGVLAATPFDRPIISFYFARGLAFVFFLLCLGIALKVIQKYKYILLLYASIPILLHQSTAVSYDVLQISLIPLIFALFVNFFNEKRVKISQLILFYFLLLFFVLIKPGYYPFLILYFLVPFSKLQIRKLHYFLLTSGLFLLGIASIFFIVKNTVLLENALVYWFYADTQLQQKFVIEHPLYFIFVFFNALFASTEPILKFMGTFGWLDYSTNIVVLVSYFIIFVLLLQKLAREESHQISFKFSSFTTLSFVVASTTFLIFLLAYLGGTPQAILLSLLYRDDTSLLSFPSYSIF